MTTSTPRIRQAGPADLDALLPLVAEFHAHERIVLSADDRRAALARLLGDAVLGAVLVAEGPGGIVGYALLCLGYSVEFGGRDAFVDEAFVLPSSRGAGLGQALLAEAEAEARRRGVRAIHLEADHANPRAAELYRRLGFRDHPRHLMTRRL
jgi:ribosomal protein S18 acetylase RimI-like enzyme